jgi:phosphate transport system substrate-binding protein
MMARQAQCVRAVLLSVGLLCAAWMPAATATMAKPLGAAGPVVHLLGAGSTFDAPFFARAFAAYMAQHPIAVTYHAVGSGAGIQLFGQGSVDFGASDVPMNPAELQQAQARIGAVLQVPVALGGVAIAYNLPGLASPLRLDGPTLAAIFLGSISRWNDAAIARLNRGRTMPDLPIVPVHRSDSSGTTYITANYLSSVSSRWRHVMGTAKVVAWPSGIGGKGSAGVVAAIQRHVGAVGYVELDYALSSHLAYASIQNRLGFSVLPSVGSVRAAAAQHPFVTATDFSIVDTSCETCYPIAGFSWVLLRAQAGAHGGAHGTALLALMRWLVTDGQLLSTVPLPYDTQQRATQLLLTIQT